MNINLEDKSPAVCLARVNKHGKQESPLENDGVHTEHEAILSNTPDLSTTSSSTSSSKLRHPLDQRLCSSSSRSFSHDCVAVGQGDISPSIGSVKESTLLPDPLSYAVLLDDSDTPSGEILEDGHDNLPHLQFMTTSDPGPTTSRIPTLPRLQNPTGSLVLDWRHETDSPESISGSEFDLASSCGSSFVQSAATDSTDNAALQERPRLDLAPENNWNDGCWDRFAQFEPLVPTYPPYLKNIVSARQSQNPKEADLLSRPINYGQAVQTYGEACDLLQKYISSEKQDKAKLDQEARKMRAELQGVQAKLAARSSEPHKERTGTENTHVYLITRAARLKEDLGTLDERLFVKRTEAEGLIAGLMNFHHDSRLPRIELALDFLTQASPSNDKSATSAAVGEPGQLLGPGQLKLLLRKCPDLKAKFDVICNPGAHGNTRDEEALRLCQPVVPDWFDHLDRCGHIELISRDRSDRYNELLNKIHRLEGDARTEGEREKKGIKPWDKRWHEPAPGWPHESWRKNGGWWRCRWGPEATVAELRCTGCNSETSLAERYKWEHGGLSKASRVNYAKIMAFVNESMEAVCRQDKQTVLPKLRLERMDRLQLEDEGVLGPRLAPWRKQDRGYSRREMRSSEGQGSSSKV